MASELPFEYTRRWPEIQRMLDSGDNEGAKQALEIRDRDLEEYLKNSQTAGVGDQLIAVYIDSDGRSLPADSHGSACSRTVVTPNVPGALFLVDVHLHAIAFVTSAARLNIRQYPLDTVGGANLPYGWQWLEEPAVTGMSDTFHGFIHHLLAPNTTYTVSANYDTAGYSASVDLTTILEVQLRQLAGTPASNI